MAAKLPVRFLFLLLGASLIMSCSAAKHFGKTTVKEPAQTENNKQAWFLYYEDLLDAKDGNVSPPGVQYPAAAYQGFLEAKNEWDNKMLNAYALTAIACFFCLYALWAIIPPVKIIGQ